MPGDLQLPSVFPADSRLPQVLPALRVQPVVSTGFARPPGIVCPRANPVAPTLEDRDSPGGCAPRPGSFWALGPRSQDRAQSSRSLQWACDFLLGLQGAWGSTCSGSGDPRRFAWFTAVLGEGQMWPDPASVSSRLFTAPLQVFTMDSPPRSLLGLPASSHKPKPSTRTRGPEDSALGPPYPAVPPAEAPGRRRRNAFLCSARS